MAQKVLVLTSCDQPHEGDEPVTEGVVTVEFGYEGKTYATELCPAHADEYHNWMQDYLEHGARLASGGRGRRAAATGTAAASRARKAVAGKLDPATIREWAKSAGHELSARGRIPGHIVEAYKNRRTE